MSKKYGIVWNDTDVPPMAPGAPVPTDLPAFLANRWSQLLMMDRDVLKPVFAALAAADQNKLMQPGYYPKLSGDAVSGYTVAVMADGKFPQLTNHQGRSHSPDGVLGNPEQNMYAGKTVAQPDPAV